MIAESHLAHTVVKPMFPRGCWGALYIYMCLGTCDTTYSLHKPQSLVHLVHKNLDDRYHQSPILDIHSIYIITTLRHWEIFQWVYIGNEKQYRENGLQYTWQCRPSNLDYWINFGMWSLGISSWWNLPEKIRPLADYITNIIKYIIKQELLIWLSHYY